jgi:phytol kinase
MRVRVRFRLHPKTSRKIYHIFIFTAAWFIQTFFGFYALIIFAGIVLLMAFDMLFIKKDKSLMLSMSATATHFFSKTTKHITVPFFMTALGGILTNIFFAPYAPLGYLVAGWGDAAGGIIGKNIGKHFYSIKLFGKYKVKKTIEGSMGVYIFSVLAIMIGLHFLGITFLTAFLVAIFFGLIITLVEAVSPLHSDNLTIQLITALLLWIAFR